MSIRQLHGWKIRKLNENFLPTQTRAVFPSFQDSSSETREAEKINFIFFFLYLLRADLNVLLIKAEATSPHYSPSFSGSLLPSPRRDGHTREVAFRSPAGHACPRVFSVFLLSPAPFTLSPFFLPSRDLCPSALWSLFPSIHGVSHYTRGPQHTVPMATRSPAIYANLLSLPNLLPSPIYGNRFRLFNSFASADRVQPSRWWCWLFSRIESWESVRSKLTICNWSVDPQSR